MDILLSALLAATPTPTVDPAETWYSPGTIGFIMTFFVTAGAIALIFDMVRRIRRVRYRAEIAEKLAAEANFSEAPAVKPTEAKSAPKPAAKPAAKPVAKAKPERPAPPAKPKR